MVSTRVCGTLSLGSNPSRHPRVSGWFIDRHAYKLKDFGTRPLGYNY